MSSGNLSQTYRHAILAVEECPLTQNAAIAATTLHVSGLYMSATPFVKGQSYTIRDDTFGNAERILVSDYSLTSTLQSDSIGYHVYGTLTVAGYTSTGWSGGLANAYTTANNASVLTPGMEMAIQSADFNCRFQNVTDTPKIEFDDEASRFATGDEGRDPSIAGARSAELSWNQKMAYAGDFTTVPTWGKIMRTTGHIIRKWAPYTSHGTSVAPATYADLETLILAKNLNANDYFYTSTGADTTNGTPLATAKALVTSVALATNDSFQVGASQKVLGKSCTPSAHASLTALISDLGLSVGDIFYTTNDTDTTAASLATLKAVSTAIAREAGDSFKVLTSSTAVYLAQGIRYSAAGIEFLPMTDANEVTATIWMLNPENGAAPSNTVFRYVGAHGGNGCNLGAAKISDVYKQTMKYNAAYIGTMEIPYLYARALTSPDSTIPEVLLNNTCTVPARVNGATTTKNVKISQFNLDMGGVVNPYIDQSTATGYAFYVTSDRDPKFSINPYMVRKSEDDFDYVVTNMVTGTVTLVSAPVAPHITIEIPNAQLLSPALASREGYSATTRVYRCLRNNTGAGAVDSNIPDQCMYSLLIGGRS